MKNKNLPWIVLVVGLISGMVKTAWEAEQTAFAKELLSEHLFTEVVYLGCICLSGRSTTPQKMNRLEITYTVEASTLPKNVKRLEMFVECRSGKDVYLETEMAEGFAWSYRDSADVPPKGGIALHFSKKTELDVKQCKMNIAMVGERGTTLGWAMNSMPVGDRLKPVWYGHASATYQPKNQVDCICVDPLDARGSWWAVSF